MRIVYAPVDTSRNNHIALPGANPASVRLAYATLLEGEEEERLLANAYLPMSEWDSNFSLVTIQDHLTRLQNREAYRSLTVQQMRQGLVGLDVAYFFFDADMLGFDYRRSGTGGHVGGATFVYPSIPNAPSIPISSGRITGIYDGGFVINHSTIVPLPEGAILNSVTEPAGQPLFVLDQ